MNNIIEALSADPRVSDWKINLHHKRSYELFFVRAQLETLRRTDTLDKQVTVYVDHDGCRGDAQFFVYPSTTARDLTALVGEAVGKALLISNQAYTLPQGETGAYVVESNLGELTPEEAAGKIAEAVFAPRSIPGTALNAVEIFLEEHETTVRNSRGLHKTQRSYTAMVEAIPTFNGRKQSVELYQALNFSSLDPAELDREITDKLLEVRARYVAARPEAPLTGPCVLHAQELATLFRTLAQDLSYPSVYNHTGLHTKGDLLQTDPTGDRLGITMAGQAPGSVSSSWFDSDGLTLGSIRLVEDGRVAEYYGSSRYGQYLGLTPTGSLPCCLVDPGTAVQPQEPYLEVLSMSGLQVDFYNDYLGGEVRLAYYHDGDKVTPVTGISISGSLKHALNTLRLSPNTATHGAYHGPATAVLEGMRIF